MWVGPPGNKAVAMTEAEQSVVERGGRLVLSLLRVLGSSQRATRKRKQKGSHSARDSARAELLSGEAWEAVAGSGQAGRQDGSPLRLGCCWRPYSAPTLLSFSILVLMVFFF